MESYATYQIQQITAGARLAGLDPFTHEQRQRRRHRRHDEEEDEQQPEVATEEHELDLQA